MQDVRSIYLKRFLKNNNITDNTTIKRIVNLLDKLNIAANCLFREQDEIFAVVGTAVYSLDCQIDMFREPPRTSNIIIDRMRLEKFKARSWKIMNKRWKPVDDQHIMNERRKMRKGRVRNICKNMVVK